MAGSVNKVILVGNVGKDPEIRSLTNGSVANLSIATSESWRDKNSGERREKTEWHRLVIWGPLVSIVEQYVRKGSKLYVEGALQTRKWTDQSGAERYATEVVLQGFNAKLVMLDSRNSGGGDDRSDFGGDSDRPARSTSSGSRSSMRNSDLDDDIPFSPEFR